jgi:hypothetical protein
MKPRPSRPVQSGKVSIGSVIGALLLLVSSAIAQPDILTIFKVDSYSLRQPKGWTYKSQNAPGGGDIHMFYGKQVGNALSYCHTTQQPLNAKLAPKAYKMNEKQRRNFFHENSSEGLLLSLHHELATAKGFRVLNFRPATLGRDTPAFSADFFFRVPQGFVYRVRSFYTF